MKRLLQEVRVPSDEVRATSGNEDDRALLMRFASTRDAVAFGELAARHEPALLGLARGMLRGNDDLAREAVQGAWLKVIRYAGSFQGSCAVKTWLYRIVMNQCRDVAARERKLATRVTSATPNGALAPTNDVRESRGEVARAVEMLPEPQREIVLLCYHAELTHSQAAEILRIPMGTLKSRLNAALTTLRGSLAAKEARV